jgi:hypothetical protein
MFLRLEPKSLRRGFSSGGDCEKEFVKKQMIRTTMGIARKATEGRNFSFRKLFTTRRLTDQAKTVETP